MKNGIASKLLWCFISTTLFISSCGDTSGGSTPTPTPPEPEKTYYKIEWKNYNGVLLETDEKVEEGTIPTYNGRTPTRESTEQYSFAFDGWTPQVVAATADATYTATYKETIRIYTITWKNYDGKILDTERYDYGVTPTYKGATPTKEKDAQYTYTFDGWNEEITAVNSDKTYTAKFTQTVNEYTVTWKNYDGTVLDSEKYAYGATPSFKGNAPTKASDTYHTYTFEKWNPSISEVKSDQTYTASFTTNKVKVDVNISYGLYNKYSMLIENYETLPTEVGTMSTSKICDANTTLNLEGKLNEGYVFLGWYINGRIVSDNINYQYLLTTDDVTLEARYRYVEYSLNVFTYNSTQGLVKIDGGESSSFNNSDHKVTNVGENVTVKAQSLSTARFLGWYEDNILVSSELEYSFKVNKEDTDLTAKWNYFTITYDVDGGTNNPGNVNSFDIDHEITLYNPTKEWYEFDGWECNGVKIDTFDVNIAKDVTLKALWKIKDYKITYVLNGGTNNPENPETYNMNDDMYIYFKDPTKEDLVFAGWYYDEECTWRAYSVCRDDKKDITVYAKWTTKVVLTFDPNGGTLSETEIVTGYGMGVFLPTPAAPEGMEFNGWCFDDVRVYDWTNWTHTNSDTTLVADYRQSELYFNVDYEKQEARVYSYTGNATSVVVPEYYYEYKVVGINSNAFKNKSNIVSISLPNSITDIERTSFRGCTSLKSINIPSSLTSIEENVFYECSSLESIVIPASVTSIGDFAFFNCTSLTSIVIPSTVIEIGSGILRGCSSLVSVSIPSISNAQKCLAYYFGYYSTSYSENKYYVPESLRSVTINGNQTSLMDYAFYECENITSVTLPNSITEIGHDVFYNCRNLVSVNIPTSLSSIGVRSFSGCAKLESVVLPNTLTSIGDYVFYGCSSLASATLPATLASIPSGMFSGCSSLETISIPNTVLSLGDYAFYDCSSLESISLPTGLTTLGYGVFNNCSSLTSIAIPNSVTTISGDYLNGCSSLESLTIPFIGIKNDPDYHYFAYIFGAGYQYYYSDNYVPESLKQVIISNACTSIPENAFACCSHIEEVVLPNTITTISNNAFSDCSSLEAITVPNSVVSMGTNVFKNCTSLEEVVWSNQLTRIEDYTFRDCSSLNTITITNSVTSIGSYAFSGCSSLLSIAIPSSVLSIESYAFAGCTGFTTFVVPDSVTSLGANVFNSCSHLTRLTLPFVGGGSESNFHTLAGLFGDTTVIPQSLTRIDLTEACTAIPDDAFNDCSYITTINVTNHLTSIGNNAFSRCTALTSFTIPNSVESIGNNAFSDCAHINAISIPSSVTTIGYYAFCNTGITSIVIPDTVTSIGSGTFNGCSLTSMTVPFIGGSANNPSALKYFFDYYNNTVSATLRTVVISNACLSIPDNAFAQGCGNITSITIGNHVTSIGSNAFFNCDGLTSIVIPDSVLTIGSYAFDSCSNLSSITLGSGVTSISESMFSSCTALTSFTIPAQVASIGDRAFSNTGLTSIVIPGTVTSIGRAAFAGCNSLASITIPFVGSTAQDNLRFGAIFMIGESIDNEHYVPQSLKTVTITGTAKISDYAFYYSNYVETISITGAATIIGEHAFYQCRALTSLTLPSTTTTIGEAAFGYCVSLAQITIPNSVSTIGNYAFTNCTLLESVSFGSNVSSFGEYMFASSGVTEVTIANGVAAIGNHMFHDSSIETVNLPNSITSIGGYAFYNCGTLTTINLPSGLESIGTYAFYKCTGLTSSITLGNSLTQLGTYAFYESNISGVTFNCPELSTISEAAFYHCPNLTSVIISNGVTSLGASAFGYCTALQTIVIPSSVLSLNSAFHDCYALENVTLPFIIAGENGRSGLHYILGQDEAIKNVIITGTTTTIPAMAFYYCPALESVTIPNTVTSIGDSAFYECVSLESFTIGENITRINDYAFDGSGLTSITIPNTITHLGANAFANCYDLTTVYWNNKVAEIGDSGIFSNCYRLNTIIIGNNVDTIPANAFAHCCGLTSVTIPNTVTSIGDCAFAYCRRLMEVINKSSITITLHSSDNGGVSAYAKQIILNEEDSKLHCSQDGFITYEDGGDVFLIHYIGNDTDITVPNNITQFIPYALSYLHNVETITIPNTASAPISTYMFTDCKNLITVNLSNTCESIGMSAFNNCFYLDHIIIPTSVTEINAYAFMNCNRLMSVVLNEGLETIGHRAFIWCYALTLITIPDSVTTIDSEAFATCSHLNSIFIPENTTTLGGWAFIGCDSSFNVYCAAESKPNDWSEDWDGTYNGEKIPSDHIHWGASRPS